MTLGKRQNCGDTEETDPWLPRMEWARGAGEKQSPDLQHSENTLHDTVVMDTGHCARGKLTDHHSTKRGP